MVRNTRRELLGTTASLIGASALAGCTGDLGSSDGSNDGTMVQASFFVFGDFAKKVAGDAATAKTLVPVGQHGHGWEPGPKIQGKVLDADLFVYGMDGFQPWTDDLVKSVKNDDADVDLVAAGNGIGLLSAGNDHEGEHDHEEETPWEWAGLYHLEAGSYTYTFHQGPDPKMHLAVVPTDEGGKHGIHHVEKTAKELYGSDHDAHTKVDDGGAVSPSSKTLYGLQFADTGETTYTLNVESSGHYVLFAQHVPDEFEAHLKDESGTKVSPEHTEGGVGHDHEDEHDHEKEGEHDHEKEGEHGHDHSHPGGKDPHFWLDPARAKQAVGNIEEALGRVDADSSDAYAENAKQYRSRLDDLDASFSSALDGASKDVVFVAGHDAFGYLGERYGFDVKTLTGLSPDDQPTPKDVERAQHIIDEHGLEYVCADPLESQTAAKQLVAETDAKEVLPLTAIPGQTQQWADENWGYVDVMEQVNLPTLKKALGSK